MSIARSHLQLRGCVRSPLLGEPEDACVAARRRGEDVATALRRDATTPPPRAQTGRSRRGLLTHPLRDCLRSLERLARLRRLGGAIARERGSMMILTILLTPVTFGFLGLMLDGSLLYATRRELQDAANAAVLAGAMQVDLDYYATHGKWRIAESELLPGQRTADDAVQEVCAAYSVTCTSDVPSGHQDRLLRVTARTQFRTMFIHLVLGRSLLDLEAESAAIMVPGY